MFLPPLLFHLEFLLLFKFLGDASLSERLVLLALVGIEVKGGLKGRVTSHG